MSLFICYANVFDFAVLVLDFAVEAVLNEDLMSVGNSPSKIVTTQQQKQQGSGECRGVCVMTTL